MPEADAVAELVQRWRAGDERAAAQLFARYGQRLVRLAEQHLSRRLAARVDGEDVVQSVFRTFFRRTAGGEFRLDSSAQIWRLLVQITLRKAGAKARYHTTGPRNAAAEVPGDAWLPEALAGDPGPAEAAALVDQIAALLRGLPAAYGSILEMRLQGYDLGEIARHLDCSVRTVQRALTLLQQRLSRESL
jgi:RNA polymerase sigma-70 factor (ECF subfamily)